MEGKNYTLWVAGSSINYVTGRGDPGISVRFIIKRNIDLSIFKILCPKRRQKGFPGIDLLLNQADFKGSHNEKWLSSK
jgi:hypothetical protein